jgi:hypothetical protein
LYQRKQVAQFGFEFAQVDASASAGRGAIDLAIGAVKVADFVGVEVDPDGESPRPSRHDSVDVSIVAEFAAVVGKV